MYIILLWYIILACIRIFYLHCRLRRSLDSQLNQPAVPVRGHTSTRHTHSRHVGVSQRGKQAPTPDTAFRTDDADGRMGGIYKSTQLYNNSENKSSIEGASLFPNLQGAAPGSMYEEPALDRVAADCTVLPRGAEHLNPGDGFKGNTVPSPGNEDHRPGS